MKYAIYPPEELIEEGVISLPVSKSITTRMLVLDAFAGMYHTPDEPNVARCDDSRVIMTALDTFRAARAEGRSRITVNVEAAGAAIRFLTAFFAIQEGMEVEITGTPRLCQRPMGPLVDALRHCGADIAYAQTEGCAPLIIKGKALAGGEVKVDATVSSQFISALLMAAPYMEQGLRLHFDGEPVSLPYIHLTCGMMAQRGVEADRLPLTVTVPHGAYARFNQPAEGDWSAAAFWFEISAVAAGWITLTNLNENSLQGDRRCAEFFECLGVTLSTEDVEEGVQLCPSPEVYGRLDLDLADNPDVAQALVVTCCLIGVPFKFVGLRNLSMKECDRLQALVDEMAKIGCVIEKIRDYGLEWEGRRMPIPSMPAFSAHDDHRMAMALAPVAVHIPGITISDAESVSKSYPEYWDALRSVGFELIEVEEAEQ